MKRYKRHGTKMEARRADRKLLKDAEESSALAEGRESRFSEDAKGIPAAAAFGRATTGFDPAKHMTTGLSGVREGKDGGWFTEDDNGESIPDDDFAEPQRAGRMDTLLGRKPRTPRK